MSFLLMYLSYDVDWDKLGTLGRAPHTRETLSDFRELCRVTRHSRVFHRLTSCQRTPGFLGLTNDLSEFDDGHFSASQGSIGQTHLTLLLSIPQVNTLPLISLLFIHFYFPYLCLSQVSSWSTLHLEVGAIPSLDLSFSDQTHPHVEPPSKPLTKQDVVVARSTISHLLSLGLLSLSIIQKDDFHAATEVLQSASFNPEVGTFLSLSYTLCS